MTIECFDTTLRDGTQGEHVCLSAQDKLRIAKRLDRFGIDVIEGGWPGSNPKDQAFFELAQRETWEHAQICAFGSTRRAQWAPDEDPNLRALLDAQTPTVSIFGKSWTFHAEVALGISLETNLDLIHSSVAFLKSHGKRVIYDAEHFFDGYSADASYAVQTLQAAAEAGADVLVLCDTNGGTLPLDVYRIVAEIVAHVDVPVGIHAHNDAGCAAANTLLAVQAGARHVQGTINGIGERCGNADLCAVLPGLQHKLGYQAVPADRLAKLTDLSRFVNELANLSPVDRAAYVGRSAFAHKGGVHVSAVRKAPEAYEHMPPDVVGNQRRVLVSDLAGQSNIRYKAEEMGLELSGKEQVRRAVDRIKELEHLGFSFEGAEASFELLLRGADEGAPVFFELERLRVRSDIARDEAVVSEATVAMRVGEERVLSVGEGQGPVDAMSIAMRKALLDFFPELEPVHLADYKVRVLTPEEGTAATVRVLIEHEADERRWSTVGVSTNIIDASWQALSDGVRYHLLRVRPVLVK